MSQFIHLYSLVPIKDGLRCVCKDKEGNHYVAHKTAHNLDERLLFEDEELAQTYIDSHYETETTRPEQLLYNVDYLPPNVIWRDKNKNLKK
jgi:hypothetical protein